MLRPSSRRARRHRKASSRYERLETRQLLTASSPGQFDTHASTSFMDVEGESVEVTLASTAEGTTSVSGWLNSAQGSPMVGVPVELGGQMVLTDDAGFFVFQFEPHQIPTASFSIPVPAGDPWFDPFNTGTQSIPMQRAIYGAPSESGTQQHPNLITSFIDASMVYGSDDARAAALRSGVGGKLKVSAGDLLPINNSETFPNGPLENDNSGPTDPSTLFVAGDVRANENVGLLSLHTLLVREHNRLADQLAAEDPGLTDEQLYQQARRLVGAMVQHITYNEYLPVLLGQGALPTYAGYDPNVDPAVSGLFSGAAFRVGHTQLIPNFQRLDNNNQPLPGNELPLRFAFFNSAALKSDGIEPYLRGLYATQMQEIDPYVIDDVRNFLFGPPGSGGMDLASINIQRGRDMGLPSYNQARIDFGLSAVTSFAEITSDPVIAAALASVYDNVDQIDVWVGGLAEDHAAGSQVGSLFHRIIADQFARSRDGDRYWFENGQFTSEELSLIRGTSLASLIQRNSTATGISGNAFTTGAAPSGPSAAGTVATESSSDYRTIDGHGNNPLDPTAGATYDYLATNYTPDYADGAAHPAGEDRPGAREISNAVIAQDQSIVNSAGTTGLFIFWGQLLDHDLGLTPGGTSGTLTIRGDQWVDPSGYQQYESISMPVGEMLGSEVAAGGDNQPALPITMLSTNIDKRNVFAHLEGSIDDPATGLDFDISLTPEEFQMHTSQAVVGWKVVAEDGSALDPAAVQIYDQNGNLIPTLLVQQNVSGGLASYVMAEMTLGDYRVTVTSQNQTVGAFHIEASMVGDFDGDRRAGALDILQILDTIGFGTQQENLHLDLNHDGLLDQTDVDLAIANFRNRTTLSPIHLSVEIDPASTSGALEEGTVTTSHVTFHGQTVPGMTLHFDTNSDGIIEETITAGALLGGFNFAHNIQLYEGSHEVTITATDRFGQSAEVRFPITRDTAAARVVSTTQDNDRVLVDAGDDAPTAHDLGSIDSGVQSAADVIQFGDTDYFKFSLSTSSDVSIVLGQLTEGMLATLYADTNGDQQLDWDQRLKFAFTSSDTPEWKQLLSAGTYYIRIDFTSTVNHLDNTAYHLSVGKTASGLLEGEPDWNPSAVDQAIGDEDLFDLVAA